MDPKAIFERYLAPTSPYPVGIEIESAEGSYLYGPEGKKYLDFISGISVTNIGHRHPKVVEAIKSQLDRHLHVMAYGEFIQRPVSELAEKLINLLPDAIDNVYFVNSGTEANEAAIKLAKRYTSRSEIVSFHKSYHGNTQGSLSVSGNELRKSAFRPLVPDTRFITFNSVEDLSEITFKTAGVIVEPVQGDAGVIVPKNNFLGALRKRCSETGSLLIFDEVQTGFGRTGSLFAYEQFGITPDIVTMAKAMGGGLPIGAFASNKTVMEHLSYDPSLGHITTFGGNPVCCAAARAVLEVLTNSDILENVEQKGQQIESTLSNLPEVVDFRRIGLMMAIELKNSSAVEAVVKQCLEKGVITYFFLSARNSLRLAPPLTISKSELNHGLEVISNAINNL